MAKTPKSGKDKPKPAVARPASEARREAPTSRDESRKGSAASKAPSKSQAQSPPSLVPPVDEPRTASGKWPKGGPTKADLKRYRQALLELRRNLLSSSKSLAAEALKASGQDFSVDHMADHGSDNYEQDFNLQLLEGEAEQLADIRDALLKIDGKLDLPFGLCEACTETPLKLCEPCPWILESRLSVIPHARLCVPTKEMQEDGRLAGG